MFGRKSEQTAEPATPQLALFNEAESIADVADEDTEEEVVAPAKRRGKRKPLPAHLPRIEVIHELATSSEAQQIVVKILKELPPQLMIDWSNQAQGAPGVPKFL